MYFNIPEVNFSVDNSRKRIVGLDFKDTFITDFRPNLANKLGFYLIDCAITEISVHKHS